MGKTFREYKGKKYKPSSREQEKKPKDKKRFHQNGSKESWGSRSGWGGMYPKHLADAIKNPPPPFDDDDGE
jgi:hypothetical protein